jgi:hypothetical protein
MSTNTTFTDTNANAFSDKLLRWELLASKLAPLLSDRPHLQPVYDELVRLIAGAKAHEFEAKGLQAAVRQSALNRRAYIKAGDAFRARLGAALAFEYGTTSVLLNEFGVKPRRGGPGRPRKKKVGVTRAQAEEMAAE